VVVAAGAVLGGGVGPAAAGADEPVRAGELDVVLAEVAGVEQDGADRGPEGRVAAGRVPGGDDLLAGGDGGEGGSGLAGVVAVLGEAGQQEHAVAGARGLAVIGLDQAAQGAVHEPGAGVGDVPHRLGFLLLRVAGGNVL
jgi:hypothetical protein